MVRASAVRPDIAQPRWVSISIIFSIEDDSRRGDWTRFSTARTTPSGVRMPTVVEPSLWSISSNERMIMVELTLIASIAYSTIAWNYIDVFWRKAEVQAYLETNDLLVRRC